MRASALLATLALALPALSKPVPGTSFPPRADSPSDKTATVNATSRRGKPQHLAAGIIYGEPDTPGQIPDKFYQEAGLRYFRGGGAQLEKPSRGWSWNEYEGRFNSTKSNYRTARKYGGTFSLLPHDLWGTDYANSSSVWPGDEGDWSSYDAFLDRLISDLKKESMLDALQFDIWNEPEGSMFWQRGVDQWVALWDRTYKRIRSDDDLDKVVITGPTTAGQPSPDSPWWTKFLESISANKTIPDQYVWHIERTPGQSNDDLANNIPALQSLLKKYSLPTENLQININEYGVAKEQVPAGAAWWISRLERYDAIGMRGNWLSKLALHDFLANLLGKPNADKQGDGDGGANAYDPYGKDYWPVGEWQVYKYYTTNMTGERLETTGSNDMTFDVYSVIDDSTIKVLAGARLTEGKFSIQVNGVATALGIATSKGSVSVKTLRFGNNGTYGYVGAPETVGVSDVQYTNDMVELDVQQNDNSTAWAFEVSKST